MLSSLTFFNAPSPSSSPFSLSSGAASTSRARMLSSSSSRPSYPPPSDNQIVLGCGAVTVDFLATVDTYPKPDDKIRSTSLKVQGGGNAGNSLTCVARLGLNPRLISKVADDPQGCGLLEELNADGVDTSFIVVSANGNSPFTYIIVDDENKTRTCIHTPGHPPMIPEDLTQTSLLSALDGTKLVYFDGRLHETALNVAREANRRHIPILVDAEKKREGLDDLLDLSTYVVCSAKFPQSWTGASSVPKALVSMLLKLPDVKFVIVTLGKDGCVMLERHANTVPDSEPMDVDKLFVSLREKGDNTSDNPRTISSSVMNLKANEVGTVCGRLLVGTAEKIPAADLIDTTGAGDAFIGAVLYALCNHMPPERMLPFATTVAAAGCKALGARTGLPHRSDPCLQAFFIEDSEISDASVLQ